MPIASTAAPRAGASAILCVHGWGSSSEYMADLAAFLASSGAEVIALDLPGHGRSQAGASSMCGSPLQPSPRRRSDLVRSTRPSAIPSAVLRMMIAAAGFLPGIEPVLPDRLVLIGAPSEMGWLFTGFRRDGWAWSCDAGGT